jgi:hypothetical protein
MTPPAPPAPLIWNARVHRWEPAGMVWDRRLCRWVPAPAATVIDGPVADGAAAAPKGPSRGPRVCKQRTRRKRIGAGSRAYQPTRDGKPVPKTKRVRWAFPKAALSS